MVLGSSYPFLDVMWTMLVFFGWVIWIWFLFTVLIDVFRRHDISGWTKAAWTLFVIVLPFLGVFTYLIVESAGMAERSAQRVDYSGSFDQRPDAASQIASAKQLLDSGAVTQAEFDQIKQKALA